MQLSRVAALVATMALLGGCQWGVTANRSIVLDRWSGSSISATGIEIRGVPAGATMTVRAESRDETGVDWTASAQFEGNVSWSSTPSGWGRSTVSSMRRR